MTPLSPAADRSLSAILYINLGVLAFTMMDGVIKEIAQVFPTGQIVFFRSSLAFLPILAFAYVSEGGITLKTRYPLGHVLRSAFGLTSMASFFLSYRLLPLSEAIALGLSGPLFLTALSVPLLGEHVGWRRWSAVLVGFLGVIVMTRPGAGLFDIAAFVPIVAAAFYALAMISIRRLSGSEPTMTIVFYFTLFGTLAGLATYPLGRLDPTMAWQAPRHWQDIALLLVIGLLGGSGQILLTLAFKRAAASLMASFEYMALVYGCIIGFTFFGEIPDRYLIAGGLIVVASGLYIVHRETLTARRRRAATPAPLPPSAE